MTVVTVSAAEAGGTEGAASASERGLLDTCVLLRLPEFAARGALPADGAVSAVSLAELAQGVAMATDPTEVMARSQRLADIEARFDPLPFDVEAARQYGVLVAATVSAGRDPRPRRIDLMIAAVAAANELPLYTANVKAFVHLDEVEALSIVAC